MGRAITIASQRQVQSRAKWDAFGPYEQTCPSCRRNGDACCLCVGRGYVTGNGTAQFGSGRKAHTLPDGFHVVDGATGRGMGRPRHAAAKLSPAARRKRKSRPLVRYREPRPVECNLAKEAGGPCWRRARHYHVWIWEERRHEILFGLTWLQACVVTKSATSRDIAS